MMADIADYFGNLTAEHQAIYEKFRSEVEELIQPNFDDYFVWKWIKATNYNIEKAVQRFKEHLKFRKRYGLDNILKEYQQPEVVKKYFSFAMLGFDYSGNIVVMVLNAFCDYKGLTRSMTHYDQIKSFCYFVEHLIQRLKEECQMTGVNAYKMTVILDMKNSKIKQFLDKTVRKLCIERSLVLEKHYPELLKHLFFINMPVYFTAWWNLFKSFLDPVVTEKFQIYSSGEWMKVSVETINPDIIPAFIGGNRTDPDGNPDCNTLFTRNSEVPESYYLSNSIERLKDDPLAKKLILGQRDRYDLPVLVGQRNSVLSWSFETVGRDIGFAVFYRKTTAEKPTTSATRRGIGGSVGDDHQVLVPLDRVASHYQTQVGELVCDVAGTYLLHFDNSYSWMRSKTLYYKVALISPTAKNLFMDQKGHEKVATSENT